MEDEVFISGVDEVALGMKNEKGKASEGRNEAYCFDRRDDPRGVTLGIKSQLIEGVCGAWSLEPRKVGLKCRHRLDAGVAGGVWWKDGGSVEERGLGRRGMKDAVV